MTSRYENRLGRQRHVLVIRGTPVASVLLASLLPSILPVIAQNPILPPFGFMVFLAWRLLRPEIWPLWIGLPFGLFDDMMSGQPFGSAIFLWTAVLIGLELENRRNFWRDYWHDWLTGALAIILVLLSGGLFVRMTGEGGSMVQILPQIAYSVALFPLVVRTCAALDRWRLP